MKFGLKRSPPGHPLILPGKEGWRQWSLPGGAGEGSPESQPIESPALAPDGAWILLPARHILSIPLWLQTSDETLFADLAHAQLDRRGVPHDRSVAWALSTIAREEGRSLVTAFLVNADLPENFLSVDAGEYDLAARALPLPSDACILWEEHRGIVAACTRGSRLAHLQFFPSLAGAGALAAELGNLLAYLKWEKIVAERIQTVLWGDFPEADGALLRRATGTDARREALPPPRFPSPPLSLLPPPVREQRLRRTQRRGQRRLFMAAATVYLALLLAVGGGLGWLKWQERKLAAQLAAAAPEVDRLSRSAARWRALQPAVDPSYYPLECLLASVQALPPDVRLTEFDHDPAKVLFLGEGKDAASIFKFLQAMEADPFLKKWKWTMPPPQLLPNNRAQFQIEGTREPAPVN